MATPLLLGLLPQFESRVKHPALAHFSFFLR
jgi:hypothetical protein